MQDSEEGDGEGGIDKDQGVEAFCKLFLGGTHGMGWDGMGRDGKSTRGIRFLQSSIVYRYCPFFFFNPFATVRLLGHRFGSVYGIHSQPVLSIH